MSYLKDIRQQIAGGNFPKFLQLWEEYCLSDSVDSEEFTEILRLVKKSDFAKRFGQYVEMAIPLWKMVEKESDSDQIIKLLYDLETTNTPELADLALEVLKKRYGQNSDFNEKLRFVGLRSRTNFQGAIANFDLLMHMQEGNIVFHTGGWGTGEILEASFLREQLVIEFENVGGKKDLSFANAFKTLIPLGKEHFLARRFSDPDLLEKEAKEDPVSIIQLLLKDLGPKTAAEIKDELSELVIPEADWSKWWQGARAKIKKSTFIESPEALKDVFRLRMAEVSHEERFHKAVHDKTDVDEIIQTTYNFVRDFPALLKNPEVKDPLKQKLLGLIAEASLSQGQLFQLSLFLENFFNTEVPGKEVKELVHSIDNFQAVIDAIDILAFKKKILVIIRELRKDWAEIFLALLFTLPQVALRDYLLKELNHPETASMLEDKLRELIYHPAAHPDLFVWYFQKVIQADKVPFSDKEGQCLVFEAFLILYSALESKPELRDLLKKMYGIISNHRYAVVRSVLEGSAISFAKEFLLLITKCHSISDHDMKILRSLVEVVHPSLAKPNRKGVRMDSNVIWTTEEGYFKIRDNIKHIGTVEIVDNAREIEAARALGDLRENSEYKFALEKRARLQSELKTLSEQFNRARIITKEDIPSEEVGIGSIVTLSDPNGKTVVYTILGPWDANPETNILSLHSKLAEAMVGARKGDKIDFKGEEYTVLDIRSFL